MTITLDVLLLLFSLCSCNKGFVKKLFSSILSGLVMGIKLSLIFVFADRGKEVISKEKLLGTTSAAKEPCWRFK